jgi:two-component system sensor histidine kinase KdpD
MKEISLKELIKKAGKSYSPLNGIIVSDGKEAGDKIVAERENELYWFMPKPWERETLVSNVRNALQYSDLLSRNEAFLETISVLAARDFSLEEKLQKILQLSLELINAEKGSIMLRDNQGDLIVKAASNKKLIGLKRFMEDKKSVSVWVVKNGKSLFVGNINRDSRFNPNEESLYKTDNFLCIPIKSEKGFIIGVFNATDRRDKKSFINEDESILSGFISRISMLIENAQLKEELEEERKRLKRKNEELLDLEEMREDLINMIIHDLKGPLGEVMANMDLLSYAQLEEQDKEYLDTAIQGSENLLRMVLNMLDVRRMEEGKLKLHCEVFSVDEFIREVVERQKTLIKQKDVKVEIVIDKGVSTWIADRPLMERVVSNLLTNAVAYSYNGGRVEILSRYLHETKQLRIEVKDHGKGIPGEFHQKVFEKFSQVDGGNTKRRHSTGLGLTFCKMAVEAHQGKIWVESEEGKGSEFIFLLPLQQINELT